MHKYLCNAVVAEARRFFSKVFYLKVKYLISNWIYDNISFNIILSGVIEQNPGPGLPKPKCPRCDKTGRCNQKRLICPLCLDVVHANCINLKHRVRNSIDAESWTFNDCLFHVLPFQNYDGTINETPAVNVSPKI